MFDQCLYFNTSALARRLDLAWSAAFEPFNVTPPQGFLLRAVLDHPGISPHELADALVISRPTATRLLDGLEVKGFIKRVPSEEDGRESFIHPTAKSIALKIGLNEASAAVTRRFKKRLGEAGFADVVGKIRGIHRALR